MTEQSKPQYDPETAKADGGPVAGMQAALRVQVSTAMCEAAHKMEQFFEEHEGSTGEQEMEIAAILTASAISSVATPLYMTLLGCDGDEPESVFEQSRKRLKGHVVKFIAGLKEDADQVRGLTALLDLMQEIKEGTCEDDGECCGKLECDKTVEKSVELEDKTTV